MDDKDYWKKYAADFNGMTDEEIDFETRCAEDRMAEDEDWLEAVHAWKAAGRPRNG